MDIYNNSVSSENNVMGGKVMYLPHKSAAPLVFAEFYNEFHLTVQLSWFTVVLFSYVF